MNWKTYLTYKNYKNKNYKYFTEEEKTNLMNWTELLKENGFKHTKASQYTLKIFFKSLSWLRFLMSLLAFLTFLGIVSDEQSFIYALEYAFYMDLFDLITVEQVFYINLSFVLLSGLVVLYDYLKFKNLYQKLKTTEVKEYPLVKFDHYFKEKEIHIYKDIEENKNNLLGIFLSLYYLQLVDNDDEPKIKYSYSGFFKTIWFAIRGIYD